MVSIAMRRMVETRTTFLAAASQRPTSGAIDSGSTTEEESVAGHSQRQRFVHGPKGFADEGSTLLIDPLGECSSELFILTKADSPPVQRMNLEDVVRIEEATLPDLAPPVARSMAAPEVKVDVSM
jgi:hypothetical protein